MNTQNLATTFAAALTRIPDNTPPKPAVAADLLLLALRNSATARDQIVQRRIGIYPDATGAIS